jgi:TatD DNase family protein
VIIERPLTLAGTPAHNGAPPVHYETFRLIMIDSHAHIHDAKYDADRGAMLGRARAAGVAAIITIGCDIDDSRRALEIAQSFDLPASIGIHPHEAKSAPPDIVAAFDVLREQGGERIVAIGETGLDYYYNHSPAADQRRVLLAQLDYAREYDLPLVFHQRDAFSDFVAILRDRFDRSTMRGVVHCFTGNTDEARTFVDEFGLRLGIGGVVTFKTAEPLRESIRAVGLDSLILETDCPYLAPVPHRGKRNEPAFMTETLARVAQVLGREPVEVDAATSSAARALFALKIP